MSPWVTDDDMGTHYVRRKKKESDGRTRTIIIEPNPPKAGEPPAVELPGSVLGSEGSDAAGDRGSTPESGGDRLGSSVGAGTQPEAGEGLSALPATEERREHEADAPAPRRRVAGDGLGRLLPGERYTK